MTTTKKLITVALAAATLAIGSLATTGDAMAKGMHGGHGWHHKWHGHRWHGRFFYNDYVYGGACYFVRKPSGRLIKICPDYF